MRIRTVTRERRGCDPDCPDRSLDESSLAGGAIRAASGLGVAVAGLTAAAWGRHP